MRWARRRESRLRRLGPADLGQVRDFLNKDPVASVLARVPVEAQAPGMAHTLGYTSGAGLSALCHIGANIVPLGFTEDGLDSLARYIIRHGRRASSIVGPADQVLGLWDRSRPGSPSHEISAPTNCLWCGVELGDVPQTLQFASLISEKVR